MDEGEADTAGGGAADADADADAGPPNSSLASMYDSGDASDGPADPKLLAAPPNNGPGLTGEEAAFCALTACA